MKKNNFITSISNILVFLKYTYTNINHNLFLKMIYNTQIFYCVLIIWIANAQAWFLESFFNRFNTRRQETKIDKEYKDLCDENQLILPLARLYVTSPERIISLLTSQSLKKSCKNVGEVEARINRTLSTTQPLPPSNLYMKLHDALTYYNSFICHPNQKIKGNHITDYHDCLRELREDIMECEGPPDWFEKSNEAVVCKYFNDIINCNYVKAALLCGLKPALMLRNFSAEIMKRVVPFKCRVSKSLPHIDNPMPSKCPYYYNGISLIYIKMLFLVLQLWFD